jgi:hypothetical protein
MLPPLRPGLTVLLVRAAACRPAPQTETAKRAR